MPRQLLILTAELEAERLGGALRGAAPPGLEVVAVSSARQLSDIAAACLTGTRLLSFCTRVIVPPAILSALTLEPYNVHPGSPEYPGLYPEAFATYDGARQFAATAHVMAPEVDTGEIIKTERFLTGPGWRREQLGERVYEAALALFFEVAVLCVASDAPLPRSGERWSGHRRSRAEYIAMCQPTGDKTEDERRLRAFEPDFATSGER